MSERRDDGPEHGITFFASLLPHPLGIRIIRHISRAALSELGVRADVIGDLELALTEACTNALQHAPAGRAYGVKISVDAERCEFDVVDLGVGFDAPIADDPEGHGDWPPAESGRGLKLMRALVDRIELASGPGSGTHVHLTKRLEYEPDAAAHEVLAEASAGPATSNARPSGDRVVRSDVRFRAAGRRQGELLTYRARHQSAG